MQNNICVFDVDGIIVDSTDECLIIAWNAYQEYIGETKLIQSPKDAESSYDKKFRLTRNYVRAMGEYLVVFEANYNQIESQTDYEDKLSKLNKKNIKHYGEIFFKNRKIFKENNYSFWLSLHTYYDGIRSILSDCYKNGNLYIVTGKDRDSSIELLFQIDIQVPLDKIFHMNLSLNKLESLKKIAIIENVEHRKIYFLDDNITHLRGPQKEGFSVALGDWGYALPEHIEKANEYGIPVISINEVMDFMFNNKCIFK
jgi:phosphoglycolate phosphatase-like HAD superfamily hydrolase